LIKYAANARVALAWLSAVGLLAALGGCGQWTDRKAITDVRDEALPAQPPPKLTAAQRFGLATVQRPNAPPPIASPAGVTATASSEPLALVWDVPDGWQQAPERMMRVVTFTAGNCECYMSVLGSAAGNLEANVNRWRGQMAQPPASSEAIAALPKVPVLGREAAMATIQGTYTGMGTAPRPGQMMLGVICSLEEKTLFVKMIGPQGEVATQTANFIAFCKSLRLGQ